MLRSGLEMPHPQIARANWEDEPFPPEDESFLVEMTHFTRAVSAQSPG